MAEVDEAAAAIGCSRTFFDEHVMAELRVTRLGRRRFIAVAELNRWLEQSASRVLEGV
jgi:excisionase family DNA binding protein